MNLSLHCQLLPNVCLGHLPKQAEFAPNPLANHIFADGQPTDFMLVHKYGELYLHWHKLGSQYVTDPQGFADDRARDVLGMLAELVALGYAPSTELGQGSSSPNVLHWLVQQPTSPLPIGEAYLSPIWLKKTTKKTAR